MGSACLFLSLAAHQASLRNGPNQNVPILFKHPLALKQVVISVPLSSGSQECLISYWAPTEAELWMSDTPRNATYSAKQVLKLTTPSRRTFLTLISRSLCHLAIKWEWWYQFPYSRCQEAKWTFFAVIVEYFLSVKEKKKKATRKLTCIFQNMIWMRWNKYKERWRKCYVVFHKETITVCTEWDMGFCGSDNVFIYWQRFVQRAWIKFMQKNLITALP